MGKGKRVQGNLRQRKIHSYRHMQTRKETKESSTPQTSLIEEQGKDKTSVKNGTIRIFFARLYKVISVISDISIISAVVLFIIGLSGLENMSDDDLIMKEINNQIPDNLTISKIETLDIHGFGNESIVVLAADNFMEGVFDEDTQEYNKGKFSIANKLLIFDKVDNEILNKVYHFLGFGSNYKIAYMFSLEFPLDDDILCGYSIELLDVIELTGDLSKELVVKIVPEPEGTSGMYFVGIFSYSFEKHSYYLLGTYPPYVFEEDRFDRGQVTTVFHTGEMNQYNYYREYDNGKFSLEYGTGNDNDIFIQNDDGNTYLVRTQMIWGNEAHVDPHRHVISVYSPYYNSEDGELYWTPIFSKETDRYVFYCTDNFIIQFLIENNQYDIVGGKWDMMNNQIDEEFIEEYLTH